MKKRLNLKNQPTRRSRAILALYLGLMLLLTSAIPAPAPLHPQAQEGKALFLVAAPDAVGYSALAESGAQLLTRLYGEAGQEHLLLLADWDQRERLIQHDLKLTLLEADSQGGTYYLATSFQQRPLRLLSQQAELIYEQGRQALIRADPHQVLELLKLGYQLKQLSPHALLIPQVSAPLWPTDITPDPVVQQAVDQVSTASVSSYDGGLSGEWPVIIGGSPYTITTRYTPAETAIEMATQYAYERFDSFGLPVSYHSYDLLGSGDRQNVIAEQTGLADPTKIIMITAHLDSYSDQPVSEAPGADDNASGSTAVLIAAQILSQYQFDYTLRYALFTGEEQGLIGSQAYAQEARSAGDDIIGVLNLDMIGYNSDSATIFGLHTRPNQDDDLAIANLFAQVIPAYGINLTPQILPSGISASDHSSFWDVGYPAVMGIEDLDDFTPYYHTTEDRLGTLDLFYFTNNVKAAVATIAHMGGIWPLPGVLTGRVYDSATDQPISGATVEAALLEIMQQTTTTDDQGHYSMTLEEGDYMVTASAPNFLPLTFSDIHIQDNHTTTLNFPLPPCNPIEDLDFIYAPSNPLAGESLTFTATVGITSTTPIRFRWDFGDGSRSAGEIVSHTYTISDVYPVTLTGANCGGQLSHSEDIEVTGFPKIDITPTVISTTIDPGNTITHSLQIHNQGADTLIWALSQHPHRSWLEAAPQEGILPPLEGQAVDLVFTAPSQEGFYTTTLQIDNDDPFHPQITVPVSMTSAYSPLEGVQINFSPPNPRTGEKVVFTGTVASGSPPISYNWGFGDGDAGVGSPVTHTYTASGAYSVTLNASNILGSTAVMQTIEVIEAPIAQVAPGSLSVNLPSGQTTTEFLQLTNPGGSPLTWGLSVLPEVPWMDAPIRAGSLPAQEGTDIPVEFSAPRGAGIYTTTMLLNSDDPLTPQISIPVTLTSECAPVSGLEVNHAPAHPRMGEAVLFSATATSGSLPLHYVWEFEDGSPPLSGPDLAIISHTFPLSSLPGTYTVELSLSNDCSGPISAQIPLSISPRVLFLPLIEARHTQGSSPVLTLSTESFEN